MSRRTYSETLRRQPSNFHHPGAQIAELSTQFSSKDSVLNHHYYHIRMMQEVIVRSLIEIWLLSFFGLCFLAVRIWVRTTMVGIKGYDLDDWLVIGVVVSSLEDLFSFLVPALPLNNETNILSANQCLWCSGPVLGHIFTARCKGRHTSDLTYEQRKTMPQSEYHEWEYGSQIYLVGLSEYFVIIWMLKFNMLCFYRRVVRNTWSEKFVKPLMGVIGVTFMVIVFTISLTCRPFHDLWKVWPDPGPRCVPQNVVFLATILSFNLTTDLCIMLVPLPVRLLNICFTYRADMLSDCH